MPLPHVKSPSIVPDETTLLTELRDWVTGLSLWNVASPPATTIQGVGAENVYVFWSEGEDGLRNLTGGFIPDVANRAIRALPGADVDNVRASGMKHVSLVGAYTNDDRAMPAPPSPPVAAPIPTATCGLYTSSGSWITRAASSTILYWASATKDWIKVTAEYVGDLSGQRCQGHLGLAFPKPAGSQIYNRARSRIWQINSGVINVGAQFKEIVLEKDITRALKDSLRVVPVIPLNADPFNQYLFFQSVVTGEVGDIHDFTMTERLRILPGTLQSQLVLGPDGTQWRTTFEIDTSAGYKLGCADGYVNPGDPGRYRDGRGSKVINGVGDIVSVLSQPTLAYAFSRDNDISPNMGAIDCVVLSWLNFGGQTGGYSALANSNAMNAQLTDDASGAVEGVATALWDYNNPAALVNRTIPFYLHVLPGSYLAAQRPNRIQNLLDNQEFVDFGILPGTLWAPKTSTQNLSFAVLDGKGLTKRYRKSVYNSGVGLPRPSQAFGTGLGWYEEYNGPGW